MGVYHQCPPIHSSYYLLSDEKRGLPFLMNVCVAKALATNACWRNRQVKNAETENPRLVSVGVKIYKPQISKKIVWRNQDPKLNLRNLHTKYLHLMLAFECFEHFGLWFGQIDW